jgi:hypothetical protein
MSVICSFLEWISDPVTFVVHAIAFYVGWNLMDWWRAIKKRFGKEKALPACIRCGGQGVWHGNTYFCVDCSSPSSGFGAALRGGYSGSGLGLGCQDPEIIMRHMGYSFVGAPPGMHPLRNVKAPEKVVDGEVIRDECKRIKHDKDD